MKYLFRAIFCFTVLFLSIDTCKALDIYQFDDRALSFGNRTSIFPEFTNLVVFGLNSSLCFFLQYINRYGVNLVSINCLNKYLNTGLYISRFGFEYNLINELSFRTGIKTRPFTSSFGAGIHLNSFTFSKRPELVFRSSCAIQYNF